MPSPAPVSAQGPTWLSPMAPILSLPVALSEIRARSPARLEIPQDVRAGAGGSTMHVQLSKHYIKWEGGETEEENHRGIPIATTPLRNEHLGACKGM